MIKINLSDKQLLNAQEKHWAWFEKTGLKNLNKARKEGWLNTYLEVFFNDMCDENYERLRNLVTGKPDAIRKEIRYMYDTYDNLISLDENEGVVAKDLKKMKETLPTQKSINDSNWNNEYSKISTLVTNSKYFSASDIVSCEDKNDVKKFIRNFKNKLKYYDLKESLEVIFSYDTFKEKNSCWNAYEWVKYLDLKVCPYCNRQFIHYYWDKNDVKKMRPALDHFYPKGLYPFLGVSLFNLVPSCYTCNSSFKGEIDFFLKKHVNPFEEDFGKDGKFRTDFKLLEDGSHDISYLTSVKKSEDFDLSLKVETDDLDLKAKINNSNGTFKINGLYQNHKDYAHEIIKKTLIYNSTRVDDLMSSFGGDLFDSKEELKQIIMGNYLEYEKQGDRVLAKLTQDIFDEFKIEEIWDESVK